MMVFSEKNNNFVVEQEELHYTLARTFILFYQKLMRSIYLVLNSHYHVIVPNNLYDLFCS